MSVGNAHHAFQDADDGIHIPFFATYANAGDRASDTRVAGPRVVPGDPGSGFRALATEDLYKFALELDTKSIWMLTATTPVWQVMFVGTTADRIDIPVLKGTAGTIVKGEVVYMSGWDDGDGVPEVELAKADAAATMPAIGVALENITDSAQGEIRVFGILTGVDTTAFSLGDTLYISPSTAGEFVTTRPTGATDLIQEFGEVGRVHATLGSHGVGGSLRANALPNLETNKVWLGDGSNQPAATARAGIDTTALHIAGTEITSVAAGTMTPTDEMIWGDVGSGNAHKKSQIQQLIDLVLAVVPSGEAVDIAVQKNTAGTIVLGQVVYLAGYDVGDSVMTVELADANAAATMPVLGLATESITETASGKVRIVGVLGGLDTSSFTVLDSLYVSGTAGDLTATRPVGAVDQIQIVGRVSRDHASLGVIEIGHAGRANGLPNLTNGQVWQGNGTNQPSEVNPSTFLVNTFLDNVFRVQDDGDATKQLALQVSGILTGTTRTWTAPNRDINIGNYKSMIEFGDYSVSVSTTTRYMFPGGRDDSLAHVNEMKCKAPFSGTVRNLYVLHTTAGVGGAVLTYTVRKNGSDTSLVVAAGANTVGGSDTTNSFTVAAGDDLSLSVAKAASIATSPYHVFITMEIEAD